MPFATRGDGTLRATARDFAYYFLRDLPVPVIEFPNFDGGAIPTDRGSFSGCAAGSQIASGGSNLYRRDYVLTQHLLFFVAL